MQKPRPHLTNWIAVDWGTTNLRVWIMGADNAVLATLSSAEGMGSLEPQGFEPALIALISDWLRPTGQTDILCCGMVGARQGWIDAGYMPLPARAIGGPRCTVAPTQSERLSVHILPGLAQAAPADVMRGEETQISGYLRHDPDFEGVLCLPGTHTKWVRIKEGLVHEFTTGMTGDIFSAISCHTVLKHSVQTADWDESAFGAAVSRAFDDPAHVATALFGIRANGLMQGQSLAAGRATLSGLLLGLELAGTKHLWMNNRVVLIGSDAFSRHYKHALNTVGADAEIAPAAALTLAGLCTAYASLKLAGQCTINELS